MHPETHIYAARERIADRMREAAIERTRHEARAHRRTRRRRIRAAFRPGIAGA